MRRFLASAAVISALMMSLPTAAAAAPERAECTSGVSDQWCFFPAPADWVEVSGGYFSCERCQAHGQRGIDEGRWSAYHCEGRVQGIDYYYHLHVPPTG